jgi:hypothetical protein
VLLSTNPSQIKGDVLRKRNLPILALAGLLFLTACGDTDPTATTTDPGSVTTAAPTTGEDVTDDIATTVAEVQSEVNELATEVQNSAAAAELEESWNALQANVLAAVAAIGDDGTIDGSAIQEELASFQAELDALGDEAEPALMEAWETLRDRLESLIS